MCATSDGNKSQRGKKKKRDDSDGPGEAVCVCSVTVFEMSSAPQFLPSAPRRLSYHGGRRGFQTQVLGSAPCGPGWRAALGAPAANQLKNAFMHFTFIDMCCQFPGRQVAISCEESCDCFLRSGRQPALSGASSPRPLPPPLPLPFLAVFKPAYKELLSRPCN